MSVTHNSPERLELEIAIPKFILWFLMLPLIPIVLIGLASLSSGDIIEGLILTFGVGGAFVLGFFYLGERTHIVLDEVTNQVTITRESRLGRKERSYPLESLDSAEVEKSRGTSDRRSTAKPMLVFRNTRPATRVPLTKWAVSGDGSGEIANAINDWLRQHHDRQEMAG